MRFAGFLPLDGQPARAPDLDAIDDLLIVVDTVNTLPGTKATIWIPELWLAR